MKTILLTITALFFTLETIAYSFKVDNIYYNITSETEKTCAVTGGYSIKYEGDVVVPSNVTWNGVTYTVNRIESRAFSWDSNKLNSVALPSSILYLDDDAFRDCERITSVNIPKNLKYLGKNAFYACYRLSSDMVVPSTIDSLITGTFAYCKALKKVELPSNLKYIGNDAFRDCQVLENIKIPDAVSYIGSYAFYNCANLENIDIPNSVKEIGEYCFANNLSKKSTLRSIRLSSQLEIIPIGCFKNSSTLQEITFPSKVKSIETDAFSGCSSLSSASFNEGLQSIGERAFNGCNNMSELILPNSLTSIGESAFTGIMGGAYLHFSHIEIGNNLSVLKDVFGGTTIIDGIVIGEGISSINDNTAIFGSNTSDGFALWGKPNCYLLTNNKVNLTKSGTYSPNCTIYVADSTKYTSNDIKKYGIRNIIHSIEMNEEYSGIAPNIKMVSELNGYSANIDKSCYNTGTYDSMLVEFSRNNFSTKIYVPCRYTISKAPLRIIANDKTITYGEEIPNLDCTYIGLKNNETADYALSTRPSLVTSAKKGSAAGTYSINISGAVSKNYSLSYTSGTLTIKKAPQNITWNQTFSTCYIGDVVELNAISSCSLPISYKSSNENIAFVTNENGKHILHFVKDGTVKITATQSGNENYEAAEDISKSFNVTAKVATNIILNQSSIRLKEGETATLIATIHPESVVEKGIAWSSSNDNIATVNNGVVTANKVGSAIITAHTVDGSNLEATCNVTVDPILASAITLNKNSALATVGDTFTLTCEIKPNNVTKKDVTWFSSNTDVATVDDGCVQTKSVGSAIISVKTTDGTNLSASCNVTVNPILVSSINLNSSTLNLNVGDISVLSVTITPDNATNKNVEWYSSNSSIASVTNGIVTAISSGSCIIKAKTTDGTELESSCVVTVANTPVSTLSLDKESLELLVDEKTTISASVYPANATNPTLSWTSSNGNVATVDDGLIMAQGAGTAVITVRTTDGTNKVAYCNVVVKKHQQSIEWNQDLSSITYGGELIEIHAEASSGLPLVYSSSNDNVISVFDMGSVVYLNPINVGTSVITVKQLGNRYYEEISVSKEAKVIDDSAVENIIVNNGKYIVNSISGVRIGVFSELEIKQFMTHNRGIFIVNGKKVSL